MVLALLVNRMNAYVQVEVSVEGIVPLTMTHLAYTAHRGQEDGRGGGWYLSLHGAHRRDSATIRFAQAGSFATRR